MTENQFPPQPQQAPQPQYNQYHQYQPMPVPPKPSKLKRFGLPVGLLLLGLIIGGASGASAVPEPVEVIKEVPVEKIVEKRVEVPKTPQSCLTALDHGESVIQSSGRVVTVFSEILDAVKTLDAARITALNPRIDAETATLETLRPKYQSARDACRASK